MQVRKRTGISLEAIKHQSDKKMYNSMVTFLRMMRDTNTDQVAAFQSIQNELVRTIAYHKRLPVEFNVVEDGPNDYVMAVLPPIFTEKHPLVTGKFANTVSEKSRLGVLKELYHNPDRVLQFGVDYDTGMFSGFAQELVSTIYIGRSMLMDGNVTPEWMATAMVHELGHVEGFYLSLRYATSSSWAIRFALELMDETEGDSDYLVTVEKIGAIVSAQDIERIKEVEAQSQKELVTAIILDRFRDKTRSEIGTSFADQTSYEALADQFLVRYGDPLAFAQFMDYALQRKRGDSDVAAWIKAAASSAVVLVVCAALTPIFSTGVILTGAILSGTIGGAAIASDSATQTATSTAYDRPYERVKRMRNELVAVIKTADNATVRGQLLSEIKALDALLPSLQKYDGLLTKIQPLFSSSLRKLRREQTLVRSLEELFNNPLYIRQAQLSQLNEIEG